MLLTHGRASSRRSTSNAGSSPRCRRRSRRAAARRPTRSANGGNSMDRQCAPARAGAGRRAGRAHRGRRERRARARQRSARACCSPSIRRTSAAPLQDLEISYRPVELRSLIEQAYAERRAVTLTSVERRFADGETPVPRHRGRAALRRRRTSRSARAISFVDVTRYAAPAGRAAARARGDPDHQRGAAVLERGARDHQRGAAVLERRARDHQRGAAVDQRRARDDERGAAVDQRGAADGQRGAAHAQRGAEPRQRVPRVGARQHARRRGGGERATSTS